MTDIPPIIASSQQSATPVSSQERNHVLDVLRGFALLGILLVNMALFSWPVYYLFSGVGVGSGPTDKIVDWVVRFFAEGKFYPLFSLLFGIGMVMQMQRAEERGVSFPRLHIRRMLALLGFGVVHAFFIWEGDILMLYALLGLVLVAFRKCKPKTLAIWIALCLPVPIVIYGGLWVLMTLLSFAPGEEGRVNMEIAKWLASQHELGAQNIEVFANGTLGEVMLQRIKNALYIYSMSFIYAPVVFAMFLAGLYAGRRGILKNPGEHLPLFRRILVFGLCVGVPGNVLLVAAHHFTIVGGEMSWSWSVAFSVALAVGCPALMLVYVSAIVLLFQRESCRGKLMLLAPVGRMALSNYLLQSIVCTTLFYSYGLGFYGSVGRAAGVVLAVVIFLLQIPLSRWWLSRFQFGPAEWLWRSVTYRRRQPMRRAVSTAAI
ncbi:MAG: DUF418 domain-containing protein [Verrucomicrobia bacterium]|nr:DUF418 domain-containing protein [Verrucomicrobiota bacterium]